MHIGSSLVSQGAGQGDAQRAVCTQNLTRHFMKPWVEKQRDGH